MSTDRYLLDSSAILTLMKDEPGADEVEEILRKATVIVPAVVLLEVYFASIQRRTLEIAQKRYAPLKSLPTEIVSELSEPVLLIAGAYKATFKISLADAMIAAYASYHEAILAHKDPEYEALTMIRQIRLPYER